MIVRFTSWLRSLPVGVRVGMLLAIAGGGLDLLYHLLPISVQSSLATSLGFLPADFDFVLDQVADVGHFALVAGFFIIAVAVMHTKIMEEERRQLEQEAREIRKTDDDSGPI